MEDEVVTEGFLLPRKTSARQLEERSQRALQNQKLSIFSGAGSGLCRSGRLGTAAPWSYGKGLPGSLRPWIRGCWELNAEFAMGKEENWRLVSQSNCSLIQQASTEQLLCPRHGSVGQKKQESHVFCP